MSYWFHPDAALEHEEQIAYYEDQAVGLGRRHHVAFVESMDRVCDMPHRFRKVTNSGIRKAPIQGFPHSIIFREMSNGIQVLAVAHHRKRPDYWQARR